MRKRQKGGSDRQPHGTPEKLQTGREPTRGGIAKLKSGAAAASNVQSRAALFQGGPSAGPLTVPFPPRGAPPRVERRRASGYSSPTAPQFPYDPVNKITVPAQKVYLPKTKMFRPINVAVEGGERWWGGRGMFLVTIQEKGGEKQFNVSAGAAESALLLS